MFDGLLRPLLLGAASLSLCALTACGGSPACTGEACDDLSETGDHDDDHTVHDAGLDGGKKTTTKDAGRDAGAKPTTTDERNHIPCEVRSILEARCGTCHGEPPSFGAPMALASIADFRAKASDGTPMIASVKARMSATDVRRRMPPASSPKLTTAELATIDAWLDEGAPAGDETCIDDPDPTPVKDAGTAPISREKLDCYTLTAHAGDRKTPYRVGSARDAYFNFTFAAPWAGSTVYGVSFRPIIDNKQVIHHWLLFQDDIPGTPSGAVGSIGAHPAGQLLTGWAPGGEAVDLTNNPDDVGVELPGNTTYTVEYHYNSSDPNARDASGVEICVQKTKPKNIAGLSWLGLDQLAVPAIKWTGTCAPLSQQPIHILSVTPHMHKMGVHMKGTINRKNGTKETLHDAPFDFDYQRGYEKNVTLMPGDTITTECTFGRPMAFGESTNAEMCYLFTLAYPKGALADLGLWGRFAHGGSACLGQ